jgi:hypothetical protein
MFPPGMCNSAIIGKDIGMQFGKTCEIGGLKDHFATVINSLRVEFSINIVAVFALVERLDGGDMIMIGSVCGRKAGMYVFRNRSNFINHYIGRKEAVQLEEELICRRKGIVGGTFQVKMCYVVRGVDACIGTSCPGYRNLLFQKSG